MASKLINTDDMLDLISSEAHKVSTLNHATSVLRLLNDFERTETNSIFVRTFSNEIREIIHERINKLSVPIYIKTN